VTVYLDSSALVKLVAPEEETDALAAFLAQHRSQATSVIGLVEVRRAAARRPGVARERVEDVLRRISAIGLDLTTAAAAGSVGPAALRALDAVHLASAAALGDDLEAFVTYDNRLADAARVLGMLHVAPGTR
jgi:uncharacterized protein